MTPETKRTVHRHPVVLEFPDEAPAATMWWYLMPSERPAFFDVIAATDPDLLGAMRVYS